MVRIYLLFVSISIRCSIVSSSESCSSVGPATFFNRFYLLLETEDFLQTTLHECVKKCRSRPKCKAFVYYRKQPTCELYYFGSTSDVITKRPIEEAPGVAMFDITAWNIGPCASHTCAADERCYPAGATYVCRKAVDVCFKWKPEDVCFRRYKNLIMYAFTGHLGFTDEVVSLHECVAFCHQNYATEYKAIVYGTIDGAGTFFGAGYCLCFSISVEEYQQSTSAEGWMYHPDISTYSKID